MKPIINKLINLKKAFHPGNNVFMCSVYGLGTCLFTFGMYFVFQAVAPEITPTEPVLLTLSLLLVLIAVFRNTKFSAKTILGKVLLVALVLVMSFSFFTESKKRLPSFIEGDYIQSWNVFHYYLGSKYFDELGYYDLYSYAILADYESDQHIKPGNPTRNLRNYKMLRAYQSIKLADKSRFTEERWQEFKKDVAFIFSHTKKSTIRLVIRDVGYNAPPFGNFVFWALSNTFSIRDYTSRTFVLGLDWIFILGAVLLMCMAFGAMRGLLVFSCFLIFFGIARNHYGAMFRFHWFALSIMGLSLYKMGHLKTAGIAFGLAISERLLPLFFVAGPVLQWVVELIKTKKIERTKLAFFISLAATGLVAFLLSISIGKGIDNYSEFDENMSVFKHRQFEVDKKMGLKRMFAQDFSDPKDKPGRPEKIRIFESQKSIHDGVLVLMVVCILIMLLSTQDKNSLFFGMLLSFPFIVVSRYYWLMWFFMLLTSNSLFKNRYKKLVFDAIIIGIIPFYNYLMMQEVTDFVAYTYVNLYVAVSIVIFAILFLFEKRLFKFNRHLKKTPAHS